MRPSRRTIAFTAAAVLLPASLLGVFFLGSEAGAETDGHSGPLATATARDLLTTETVTGSLARAETKTIVYGGTSSGVGGLRIAASSKPEVCPTPAPTPTASPAPGPSPSASPSPGPTPCETPEPVASPSPSPTPTGLPSPEPTPGPSPSPSSSPSPEPSPTAAPDPEPRPEARAPDQAAGQTDQTSEGPVAGGRTPDNGGTAPQGDAKSDPENGLGTPPAPTLTGVLEVGAVADRGSVLYLADTEPVVALLAPEALFRDLSTASSDGDDIRALEENLSALGYGSNLTVDRHFDSATGSAVKRWEEALGRESPDGVVSVGEVVFIVEPAAVISRRARVGDKLNVGTPVLTLGTRSMVVTAKVDVADRSKWSPDTVVRLDWADQPGTGTVIEVGKDEVDGQVEVTIALGADAPSVPVGTEVDAEATTAERDGVVTIPVSAVFEGPDGPSVRTEAGEAAPVELGIVSGGLAEITEGLKAGTKVRLPGWQ